MPSCSHGCVLAGAIHVVTEDMDEMFEFFRDELSDYPCYMAMYDGEYGHENYAAMAYAVHHGHLECLKRLHRLGADWHGDLAICAQECDQKECLAYILTEMGDVEIPDDVDVPENDVIESHGVRMLRKFTSK